MLNIYKLEMKICITKLRNRPGKVAQWGCMKGRKSLACEMLLRKHRTERKCLKRKKRGDHRIGTYIAFHGLHTIFTILSYLISTTVL